MQFCEVKYVYGCQNHPSHFFQEETQVTLEHVKSTPPVGANKRLSYPHLAVILNQAVMGAITMPSLTFIFLKKGIMGTLLATVGCVLLTGL